MPAPSRLQLARRRLRVARYAVGALAVGAFAGFGDVVRDAHPATHPSAAAAPTTATTVTSGTDEDSTSVVISPAPQTVAPTIQSGGS